MYHTNMTRMSVMFILSYLHVQNKWTPLMKSSKSSYLLLKPSNSRSASLEVIVLDAIFLFAHMPNT